MDSASPEFPAEYWELADQYREQLVRQASSILGGGSREDAEDVVQETFVKAFRDKEKLSKAESLSAWLMALNRGNALNRKRMLQRSRQKIGRRAQQGGDRSFTTGGFSGIELRDLLGKAMEALPPSLRALVVLRYVEHLSYNDIAQRLNIPLGTVDYLLSEASTRMYETLKAFESPRPPQPSTPMDDPANTDTQDCGPAGEQPPDQEGKP